jgi:hypothetical protein
MERQPNFRQSWSSPSNLSLSIGPERLPQASSPEHSRVVAHRQSAALAAPSVTEILGSGVAACGLLSGGVSTCLSALVLVCAGCDCAGRDKPAQRAHEGNHDNRQVPVRIRCRIAIGDTRASDGFEPA